LSRGWVRGAGLLVGKSYSSDVNRALPAVEYNCQRMNQSGAIRDSESSYNVEIVRDDGRVNDVDNGTTVNISPFG
jgi:hypothetical protein